MTAGPPNQNAPAVRMTAGPPNQNAPAAESLAELVGACIRMARHWPVPHTPPIAPPSLWKKISGVSIPGRSARLLDGMSDYGD